MLESERLGVVILYYEVDYIECVCKGLRRHGLKIFLYPALKRSKEGANCESEILQFAEQNELKHILWFYYGAVGHAVFQRLSESGVRNYIVEVDGRDICRSIESGNRDLRCICLHADAVFTLNSALEVALRRLGCCTPELLCGLCEPPPSC